MHGLPEGSRPDKTDGGHPREPAQEAWAADRREPPGFLAHMNHEIRTPMNAILGMTGLALMGELAPQERAYVGKARAAAQALSGILSDLLDFAEIESGDLRLEDAEFVPANLLDSVVNAVGAQAREKGLDFLLHLDPDVPSALRGDALRLSQVLVKLAGNAIKYTERGGVVVAIERRGAAQGRLQLRFSVTDTGIGLPGDAREWRLDDAPPPEGATVRRPGGVGLGLAICRALVGRMDGRLWAEKAPGGTVFQFDVSLLAGREVQAVRGLAPGACASRVLVVDDSDAFATLIAAYIGSLGLAVETAGDAETGLERLRAAGASGRPFDMLVADWHLPVMDGIELARHALSAELRHRPAVLLVTGANGAEAAQEAHRKGIVLHSLIEKPLTLRQVRDALARPAGEPAASARAPRRGADPVLAGARVLLVDDHPVNRELVKALLAPSGVEIHCAGDGAEALALLRRSGSPRFDLVLMDCQMPVMDGYRATEEIRKNPEWRDLPVIALTANAMPSDRERAFRAGMNDHVSKPVNLAVLLATMANWLGRARGPAETPPS